MLNCACFAISCIILLVLPSITRDDHIKVLALLHLLQCIAVYLQRTFSWVSGKTKHFGLFVNILIL